ncbi:MAG: S41 family peptidase [Marinifilaceae bacterium]|jgi:Tol biopolymer transport system component/C-terminal processing protease CtpA/Prc|nr:S41 family peptidase [Marinifilaceae bacterium]
MLRKILFITAFLVTLAKSLLAEEAPLWLRYCAISPDGSTVAFTYQGDIYTVPVEGGEARLLTYNKAYDKMPIWSPDSKKIAFTSNRHGSNDVYIVDAKGGKPQRLSFYSGGELASSFTPDGKNLLFVSVIRDNEKNAMFPSGVMSELYSVPVAGGAISQVLTTPALDASYNKDMTKILYRDSKGYEDHWRKHHTSAVTRDIWIYDTKSKQHTKISDFKGEDLYPVFSNSQKDVFYLSEQSGSFNIWKAPLSNPKQKTQITNLDKHPIRFLSISSDNKMCFSYNGELYTVKEGEQPQKINISILADSRYNEQEMVSFRSGAEEFSVSPDGKEIAFIVRGEVFVTSVNYGTTKRITNTPEQERSVMFSPDGKKLLYASERDGSWNLYQTKLVRKDEKQFSNSTLLKEEPILISDKETFQPKYSPDGKEIAFLEERVVLKVINLESKKIRKILDKKYNYSYSDGDQHYDWSPDGKWFLVDFYPHTIFTPDVGLISASGEGELINLTESGYADGACRWSMKGDAMIWNTDRRGYRSHGSWGSQSDVYIQFFNKEAFDNFKMTKEERELAAAAKKDEKKKEETDSKKKKSSKKKKDSKNDKDSKNVKIEFRNLDDMKVCLTINPSKLSDAILTPDGKKLFYLSRFEGGYDLWLNDLEKKSTTKILKLNGGGGAMQFDKDAKNLFLMSGNSIIKVDVASNSRKNINYNAQMNLNKSKEREYLFEHVWRQFKKKFYDPNMHGVDWDFYKSEYQRFLPHINNNFDFADMLSELLGEMNASHTGSGFRYRPSSTDRTADLGVFYDWSYKGAGVRISEIIEKGPLDNSKSKAEAGVIIERIDDNLIGANTQDFFKLLNHKAGKKILLSLYNPKTKQRWTETVKPISYVGNLLYKRWVKQRQDLVEKLSGGKIGYVHVRGMNSDSYREVYSEMLGKYGTCEAIIVDTRFNGGGWLHDDLVTLLSGKVYTTVSPRGQDFGTDPLWKWKKPSAVIVGESNYSDACGFPYAYKTLGIGKLVGMPVPGTMTAVWWETLQDPSLYFGIPMVGMKNLKGEYIENKQVEPDIKVANDYEKVSIGIDQQLEATVKHLLEEIKK